MFNKNRFKFRSSIRGNGQNRSFSKPSHQGNFSRFSNNRFSNKPRFSNSPRKSALEGANINMFIKKANPTGLNLEENLNKRFEDLNLISPLKQNIKHHGYTECTPIQSQTIEPILEGKDVIGLASTGTGKTAAFLIPLINKLFQLRGQKALIIVPTRELAVQINDEFRSLSFGMHIYSALLIGGSNLRRQMHILKNNHQLVIATPGRLKDLVSRKVVYLEDYSNIVLDEVDLMVDIGFINDVRFFISLMPKVRQSLFFSATISPKVRTILDSFVTNPVTVSVKKQETSENVEQNIVKVEALSNKTDKLHDLLIKDEFNKVLIFLKTKHGVDRLHKELEYRGFKLGSIHGNKSQGQRQRILQSFKRNEINILLATDVASRGLDIENVSHVINYDLPQTYEDYIHRIGRTGRAGKTGFALTFVN